MPPAELSKDSAVPGWLPAGSQHSQADDRRIRAYALAGWRHRMDGDLPTGPQFMARVEAELAEVLESERRSTPHGRPLPQA